MSERAKRSTWGFIDRGGTIVIEPQFDNARSFSEGLAAVTTGGKVGFIDRSGRKVIPAQFDTAASFREGLARVTLGDKEVKIGYVDASGRYAWEPQN